MRRLRPLYLLTFLLLWSAAAPDGRAQKLAVSPEDKALVMNGTLGSGATSFTRHFTVTLVGGTGTEAKQIQTRRSDLVMQGPNGEVLDRGNLNVATIALKPGQTMDAALTVNNVTRAGTYTATIKLWLPEQTEAEAEVINLTLNVAPRVVVSSPTGASAQVAHCGLLPCRWSGWLPQNLIGNKRALLLDNQTLGDVVIENQYVVLRGERTGRVLTAAEVRPSVASQVLPASRSVPVDLEVVDRDAIPPDSYIGTLRLGLRGAENPTVVGFTLNVRTAPWWPLVILLIGVIAGRVIKKMSTPEALLQVKLLKRLFRIQDSVVQLRSEPDRQLLLGRLDDLKARIDSGSETEQVLTQELDKMEVAVRLLRRLEVLEDDTAQITDVTVRAQILTKIDTAAQTLLGGNATETARLINEIEVSLRQAQTNMADAVNASETVRVESALASAREARILGDEADKVFNAPAARIPGWPERILATLAGSDLMSAGARFWVWRPIFFLLLLLLLTFMGLKSLYIDNGTSFGVGGLYDYLGLFLWGLSAEVVQHTLQTVSLPRT
ncbi:MAG TPA: hypothetical protein VLB46_11940 [Pyrinomonadaceae bacterium]|nr:hypothetical protein [Pyrinomonadaceae bacterium]